MANGFETISTHLLDGMFQDTSHGILVFSGESLKKRLDLDKLTIEVINGLIMEYCKKQPSNASIYDKGVLSLLTSCIELLRAKYESTEAIRRTI